jgi:NAD(P)-dependent dehydrogenase (short-subunit alcohol dehydrogenase family)
VVTKTGERELAGRRILITGGLGAIGREVVAVLGEAGAHVVVNDIVLPAEVGELPAGALGYLAGDAADPGAADGLLDAAEQLFGGLPNVVCCHAGIVRSGGVLEYELDDLAAVWRANVLAPFALAQAAARRWVAAEAPGILIFTGSWVQDVAWPGIAAYSSSKAALRSIARSFARELAPHGIRANVVAPGIVGAGMALRQWNEEPEYRARTSTAIPLGELQSTRSVADAIAFLASDRASYMTGATLLVDGGASLYPMDADPA